jgi:hypothetical protein
MNRCKLGELQVAQPRSEKVGDNLAATFVRFGSDLLPDCIKPSAKPLPNGDPVRVNVLASIE